MKSLTKTFILAALFAPFVTGFAVAQEEPQVLMEDGAKVYVKIAQSPDLTGQLLELNQVSVNTSFGTVNVPMDKVDGIKMNIGSEGMAVIAFKNGDMVTGKIEMKELLLRTNWGKAHIAPVHIETITMDKDGRFFQDGPSGKGGWRFSKAVEVPTARPGQSSRNSRTNVNPTTLPRQFGQ